MKISALFINHNSDGTILKAIQALLEQEIDLEEILVVDNGSSDGGPEQIRQKFPQVNVHELGANLGLSHARNAGLKMLNADLVLLLDDDVYLSKGALNLMLDAYRESGAVIICPRIVLYPESDVIQCDGAAVHFAGVLTLHHAYQPLSRNPPSRRQAQGFIGACLLLEQKRLLEHGYFDEDYFFYFEDLEFSYRLQGLGYEICCEERAIVFHDRGAGTANLSFRGLGAYPAKRAYFNFRNRWLTIWIHYQLRTLLILAPALLIYELAAFMEAFRRSWLRQYFSALRSLLNEFNSIQRKRRHWQCKRLRDDGNILIAGELPFSRGFVDEKYTALVSVLNGLLNGYWKLVKKCL